MAFARVWWDPLNRTSTEQVPNKFDEASSSVATLIKAFCFSMPIMPMTTNNGTVAVIRWVSTETTEMTKMLIAISDFDRFLLIGVSENE